MPKPNATDSAVSLLSRDWLDRLHPCDIHPVKSGMSAASVYRVVRAGMPTAYLKIMHGHDAGELRAEAERTRWLGANGICVPPVFDTYDRGDVTAALFGELAGWSPRQCERPAREIIDIVARGLKNLHSRPVAECPFDEGTPARLRKALSSIQRGEVDPAHFADRNTGLTARQIYDRLVAAVPEEDLVVIHGDATFDNLRLDGDNGLGFLDCGRSGVGDRYVDLVCVIDSIEDDLGREWVAPFLASYGLPAWDARRARFFGDLYELF
jgi:aminoglycoside 3'-phosphotransferase II